MKLRWDHPFWQRRAPALARKLVQLYLRTCPAVMVGHPQGIHLMRRGTPVLFAAWHCHLLFPLYYYADHFLAEGAPPVLMASPSRDGEFIAQVARELGFIVCSGSRRKGGVQTLQRLAAYVRRGHSCGLVADGSRGPARVAQKGPIYLARETQVPILPLAVACRHKITFRTWDRFELPLPFSRLALLVGEPLIIPAAVRGPALEPWRRELEARLNHLSRQSQAYFDS